MPFHLRRFPLLINHFITVMVKTTQCRGLRLCTFYRCFERSIHISSPLPCLRQAPKTPYCIHLLIILPRNHTSIPFPSNPSQKGVIHILFPPSTTPTNIFFLSPKPCLNLLLISNPPSDDKKWPMVALCPKEHNVITGLSYNNNKPSILSPCNINLSPTVSCSFMHRNRPPIFPQTFGRRLLEEGFIFGSRKVRHPKSQA